MEIRDMSPLRSPARDDQPPSDGAHVGGGTALLLGTEPPGSAAGSGARAQMVFDALSSRFARVDVVAFVAPGDEHHAGPGTHLMSWPPTASRWTYWGSLTRGGSAFVPIRRSRVVQRVAELARHGELLGRYDLLWAHHAQMAAAAAGVAAAARVLDVDAASGADARRSADAAAAWMLKRAYLRLDAAATARRERRLCAGFDRVVVASSLERQRLGAVSPAVTVVPNVVPSPSAGALPADERDGLLFVGTLDYEPNVEAVRFLVDEVMPRVRARRPGASLTVAGRNPTASVQRLARAPGVTLVSGPASLRPLYRAARAVVAPLVTGGGTRIKVLEAMAAGLPIVGTPVAFEGITVEHGREALVAAEADAFAEACLAVLADSALADRLGRAAGRHWARHHRPEVAHAAILALLDDLARPAPAPGGALAR